jgi:hypothetical protein
MPLDVVRLRDSDLAALEEPAACWAAVLLWCASWHQLPAASLPDDDRILAQLAGFGRVIKEWMKVRPGALRGWLICSDGRLYHPVVSEKAREAWQGKLEQRWRTECARIKKHNQRYKVNVQFPTFEDFLSKGKTNLVPRDTADSSQGTGDDCPQDVTGETASKGQGEGQGQGDSNSVPTGTGDESPPGLSAKEAIYSVGLSWMLEKGCVEKSARSLLGAGIKTQGDDKAWELVQAMIKENPIEPAAWLSAALNVRANKKRGGDTPDARFEN